MVQQLNAYENNKMFTIFISKMSNDALKKISDDGIDTIKALLKIRKSKVLYRLVLPCTTESTEYRPTRLHVEFRLELMVELCLVKLQAENICLQ